MAIIAVQFGNIAGECTIAGHADHVDAMGLRERLAAGLGAASGAGRNRTLGMELVRFKDSASPRLAQACSSAENLGEATVRVFRNSEQGPVVYMAYTLGDTYVERVEQLTLDLGNLAYAAPEASALALPAGYANREVERVHLNVNQVSWTYTLYEGGVAGGVVERGFNLRTGTSV